MKKLCEGWKEVELGDEEYFTILSSGINEFDGEKDYLSTESIKETKINKVECSITYKDRPSRANMQLVLNSVWFAKMQATLKVYSFDESNEEEIKKYILSTGFAGIKINEELVFPKYLRLLFISKEFNKLKDKLCTGSTQKGINNQFIKKISLVIPPLQTQKAIVSISEKAENAKEWRKKTDDLTKDFLKSVFLEMFGDPIKNTLNLPQEKGRELFKFSSGKFNPTSNLKDSYEFPTYGGNGVTGYSKDFLIEYPTLVIGRVGAYCGSVHKIPTKSWITDNAIFIKEFKKEYNLNFLYYLLDFLKLNRFALTVGQPKITQKPLEELDYIVPPLPLQNKFADIVQEVEKLKQHQKKSREEIDNLFNALMQKAFKGELVI